MLLVIKFISMIFIFLGNTLIFIGVLGLIYFNDFLSKTHASTLIESLGIPLLLFGISLINIDIQIFIKIIFCAIILIITTPISSYIISKSFLKKK